MKNRANSVSEWFNTVARSRWFVATLGIGLCGSSLAEEPFPPKSLPPVTGAPEKQEPPKPIESNQWVVLLNGSILTGKVEQSTEYVHITSAPGTGETRIPRKAVQKVCTSATQVYELLQKSMKRDSVSERLRIARWCLTAQLLAEARKEGETALALDPRSNDAKVFLRQMDQLQSNITQASRTSTDAIPKLPAKLPLKANLEDWPKAATTHALTDFTRKVQPILLNGCGTGACHGKRDGSREFVLYRGLGNNEPNGYNTRQNLEHVLALIDREKPDESMLLRKALDFHGNMTKKPFGEIDSVAYLTVQDWLIKVSGKEPVAANPATTPPAEQITPTTGGGFASQYGSMPGKENPGRNSASTTFGNMEEEPPRQGNFANSLQNNSAKPVQELEGGLPTLPGLTGSGRNQMDSGEGIPPPNRLSGSGNNMREAPEAGNGSRLPTLPGLSGNASSQVGGGRPTNLGRFEPPQTTLKPGEFRSSEVERKEYKPEPPKDLTNDKLRNFLNRQQGTKAGQGASSQNDGQLPPGQPVNPPTNPRRQ